MSDPGPTRGLTFDGGDAQRLVVSPRPGPASLSAGVTLRAMTFDDIPAALGLCRASNWNQTARDWQRFLSIEPHGATVAVRGGHVIGSVTTLRFGDRFGWIAMVLVEPAERGHGVGRALLLRGLSALSGSVARLDATPAGETLYRQLGFAEEYRLTRFQREAAPLRVSSADRWTQPLQARDWAAVFSLDEQVFGADRSSTLQWLAAGAPEFARVARSPRGVQGFVLGRRGHDFDHLGPVVATDTDVACNLVAACLVRHPQRRLILDAPDQHASWRMWLHESGFTVQRPFIRMHRGQHRHPGLPARLFASIGPEFG